MRVDGKGKSTVASTMFSRIFLGWYWYIGVLYLPLRKGFIFHTQKVLQNTQKKTWKLHNNPNQALNEIISTIRVRQQHGNRIIETTK